MEAPGYHPYRIGPLGSFEGGLFLASNLVDLDLKLPRSRGLSRTLNSPPNGKSLHIALLQHPVGALSGENVLDQRAPPLSLITLVHKGSHHCERLRIFDLHQGPQFQIAATFLRIVEGQGCPCIPGLISAGLRFLQSLEARTGKHRVGNSQVHEKRGRRMTKLLTDLARRRSVAVA